MTPQELKNSILQRAIQGKLVPQDPKEGFGEELLRQIRDEKTRLLKEGKIKKEKPLPEIADDEKPFEIPDNWVWVRLQNIVILNPKNELSDETEVGFVPMALISEGYGNQHSSEIRCWKDVKRGFTHFANGDVGLAKITPCFQNRKSVIFQNLKNGYGAGTTELSVVRIIGDSLSREFLLSFFKSPYFIDVGVKSFTGTAGQQRIHKDYLSECLFPLPPLSEQKRIVSKLESLRPFIESYSNAWTRLEELSTRFPSELRRSLLQRAIKGRLVARDPSEGTGADLLCEIQKEKKRLLEEGKIKKEKPLPEIADDEKPFEIPGHWTWVRLQNIVILNPKNELSDETEVGFVPMALISEGYGNQYSSEIRYWKDVKKGFTHFANGDVGLAKITPCFQNRKSVIFQNLKNGYGAGTTELSVVRIIGDSLSREFLLNFFKSPYFIDNGVKSFTGTAGQQRIHKDYLSECLFPLPPLSEQKRIVQKLKELLPLCERLTTARQRFAPRGGIAKRPRRDRQTRINEKRRC